MLSRTIVTVAGLCLCACNTPHADATPTDPAAGAKVETAVKPADTTAPDAPPGAAATATPVMPDPDARAAVGEEAPDFTLPEVGGEAWSLRSARGKTVVLEWFNPDCPFIKYAHGPGPLRDMAKRVSGPSTVWVAINSGAPGKQGHGLQRNREAKQEYGIEHPVLLDEQGVVGHAYGAAKTPHMFVIDPAGTLVYAGALDNAPIGTVDPERPRYPDSPEGAPVNYVQGALDDLAAAQPLRLSETPAYGCSVKYGDGGAPAPEPATH